MSKLSVRLSHAAARKLRQTPWLRWCIAAFLWLAALMVVVVGGLELREDVKSTSWPTTEGVVTDDARVYSNRRKTVWGVSVHYHYRVANEAHTSDRIRRSSARQDDYYFESKARDVAAGLPKGKRVTVFYPPDKPYLGILNPGVQALSVFMIVFGLLLALWAFVLSISKKDNAE
ncbi:MAG: DUF3592 domain-containing protein [Burkholderiales bacterium]|nr:DUF3592 domain-containing protein [Burkholderiales bacterium]